MTEHSKFKQLLINTVPNSFLRSLIKGIENIYPESHNGLMKHPCLDEDQAKYVLGYMRRGFAETALKRAADQHGVPFSPVIPENGGCTHIQITLDKLNLALCHVSSAGAFPKHSDSREQSSQVNLYAAQAEMFPKPQKNAGDEQLFGIIVHTEKTADKSELGHIHVGLPDPAFKNWIHQPIDLRDILHIQERNIRAIEDRHAEIQDAEPKWKKPADTSIEEGKAS